MSDEVHSYCQSANRKSSFSSKEENSISIFILLPHRNLMTCHQNLLIRFFLMENPAEDGYHVAFFYAVKS